MTLSIAGDPHAPDTGADISGSSVADDPTPIVGGAHPLACGP